MRMACDEIIETMDDEIMDFYQQGKEGSAYQVCDSLCSDSPLHPISQQSAGFCIEAEERAEQIRAEKRRLAAAAASGAPPPDEKPKKKKKKAKSDPAHDDL